jgi:SAM-dependent methyltransferase
MLQFVTKDRYWKILDDKIMDGIPGTPIWHIKDIQDAVALSHLFSLEGQDIAEIGAGNSRLLAALSKKNRCWAIDEYKGFGGGPRELPKLDNVHFVVTMVGQSRDVIPNESFDAIFSVSVVEHVETENLEAFFDDCHRILRKGGKMIHLIDLYLNDHLGDNNYEMVRIKSYLNIFHKGLFQSEGELHSDKIEDIFFRTSYATNPDNMMRIWNNLAPSLLEKRKKAQSCTIELVGLKR